MRVFVIVRLGDVQPVPVENPVLIASVDVQPFHGYAPLSSRRACAILSVARSTLGISRAWWPCGTCRPNIRGTGNRRIRIFLQRVGYAMSVDRTHRLWRLAGLQVARRRPKIAERRLPGLIFHDFRRTAVRNLERAGVPRSVAMKMVRHKTEAIYRRYAIFSESDLREAALKLEAVIGSER
jgi:hypothetical protein